MFCKKCGKPVSDKAHFCAYCGEALSPSAEKNDSAVGEEKDVVGAESAEKEISAKITSDGASPDERLILAESADEEKSDETAADKEQSGQNPAESAFDTVSRENSESENSAPRIQNEPLCERSEKSRPNEENGDVDRLSCAEPKPSEERNSTEKSSEENVSGERNSGKTVSGEKNSPAEARKSENALSASQPSCRTSEKASVGVPTGLRILSAFLCLLLFSFALSASFIGLAKPLLNSDTLIHAAENISPAALRIDGETFARFLYDACDAETREQYALNEEKIEALLNDLDLSSFLENIVKPYLAYLFGETDTAPQIDAEDVVREIKRCEDAVYRYTGYRLTDADYHVMENEIRTVLDEIAPYRIPQGTFSFVVRFGLAYLGFAYGVLIALSVVMLLLVFLSNRMRLHESSLHLTVTFFACAFIFLLIFGGFLGFTTGTATASAFIAPALVPCAVRAGGYLLLGILFLILYKVTGKRKKAPAKTK